MLGAHCALLACVGLRLGFSVLMSEMQDDTAGRHVGDTRSCAPRAAKQAGSHIDKYLRPSVWAVSTVSPLESWGCPVL